MAERPPLAIGPGADMVAKPPHYVGAIEPCDLIDAQGLGFYEGSIVQYLVRHRKKNGVEDLKKARWYLDRLIGIEEGKNG